MKTQGKKLLNSKRLRSKRKISNCEGRCKPSQKKQNATKASNTTLYDINNFIINSNSVNNFEKFQQSREIIIPKFRELAAGYYQTKTWQRNLLDEEETSDEIYEKFHSKLEIIENEKNKFRINKKKINNGNIKANALKHIGEDGLIINSKSNDLFTGKKFSSEDIERNMEIISIKDPNKPNDMKRWKYLEVLLYYQAEYNPNAIATFNMKFDLKDKLLKNVLTVDLLHIIFNIIEFEDKFHTRNTDQLKLLLSQLKVFKNTDIIEKKIENQILYRYYCALLNFMLKDFLSSKADTMETVIDLNDVDSRNKTRLMTFVELKNTILNLKLLEAELEKDTKEIISQSECLFDLLKKHKESFALKMGYRMCDLQYANYEFEGCFKTLNSMHMVIKKQMLLPSGIQSQSNDNNELPDIVEQLLIISSRQVFCNLMLGNGDECIKHVKKIEKILLILKDTKCEKEKEALIENLILKYSFYLIIYKVMLKIDSYDKGEVSKTVNSYKSSFKNHIGEEDDTMMDLYLLNTSDNIAPKFFEKFNSFLLTVQNSKFIPNKYIPLFFYIYNQMAVLTGNIRADPSVIKQLEYIGKIKEYGKSIVDYTIQFIDVNATMKILFSFPYCQEMLIKIFCVYIYSFYYSKKYTQALEISDSFDSLKSKFDLSKENLRKSYCNLIKLRGDILFKLDDFNNASKAYTEALSIYEDINNYNGKALTLFNLGICYLYVNVIHLAKENFTSSLKAYESLNRITPNAFSEKISLITKVLSTLNL